MIILFLILVEEDIFEPKLPAPIIEPKVSWVYSMDENWINIALAPDRYHLSSAKIGNVRILSIKQKDFSEHYTLSSSIRSISYKLQLEYTNWDGKRITKANGWKWIYYKSNLFLSWMEGVNIEDSLLIGGGVRYYHAFPSFSVGCWINYLNTPDYGITLIHKGYRVEFGIVRRCVGYTGDWGDVKVGRFRDRFPTIFFPLKKAYPRYLEYYGAKINLFNLDIIVGRKNYYTKGIDTLQWEEGECYFTNARMELGHFGFSFSYQKKGLVKSFGNAYFRGRVDWLGYELSLRGFSKPMRYLSGGLSIWIENNLSPFISVRNISYSPSHELLSPVYYIGIHYAH